MFKCLNLANIVLKGDFMSVEKRRKVQISIFLPAFEGFVPMWRVGMNHIFFPVVNVLAKLDLNRSNWFHGVSSVCH